MAGVAEETLTAIKVVSSYCQEEREIEKFKKSAAATCEIAKAQQLRYCLMVGLMKFSIFFFYSYSLFIGSLFIEKGIVNTAWNKTYDG